MLKAGEKMSNMEAEILSREIIKPSSPQTLQRQPFKISLFDQLTPFTYISTVTFYSSTTHDTNGSNNTNISISRLKSSLSDTLNILYPFSGRTTTNNMFIDRFDQGVPLVSARMNCRLSEFLKHHQIESLNQLLPCQPLTKEASDVPLLVVQVTSFACGGIAVGSCACHKITDAKTGHLFFDVWSRICRGVPHQSITIPGLGDASLIFPPRNELPQNYLSMMENLWFTKANYITRKFTFDAKSVAKLREMAKGEGKAPTRTEAVTGFLWKCSMAASRAVSGSLRTSVVIQAVNMRPRGKRDHSLDDAIGNVFWWASALANPAETGTELSELVKLMKDSIAAFDEDYMNSLEGEKGFEAMADYFNQLEFMFSSEAPDIFAFTSWSNLVYNKVDYGWGPPCSFGPFGKVGPAFRNLTVLVDSQFGRGIDAWITLDEDRMSALQKDPELLTFASPNLKISSL